MIKKIKFDVQGMTCSSCSAHVEKAVVRLNGVQKVNVNLLSNNMIVEYNDEALDNDKIIEAVIDAGYGASLSKNNINKNINSMKKRLIASFCFWIPLMYIAMYHMFHEWFGLPIPQLVDELFTGAENAFTFGFTQLLLVLPIVYINRNYFITGFKHLAKRAPTMESLIAIGSSAALIYGIYALYMIGYGLGHNKIDIVEKFSMDLYFESAGTILTLITFGKYLETKSKEKTTAAIEKLVNLAPKTAIVEREGKENEIQTEEIQKGDVIVIKPGSSIPVDGIIIEGNSSINEASITGESIPVDKNVGDTVISGTTNENGYFKMKATKVGEDTTLSQIIKLVEEANNSKAPISKVADKVSGVFVPCVILIAIIAAIFWILNGQSLEFALSIGISVLVISCPCALGLATPVAIMVGTGKGASQGILIKSAEKLELLHLIDTVVFDKTGTITEGKPKVSDIVASQVELELLKIAASLEKNSEHPLGAAIVEKAKEEKIDFYEVKDFVSVPGRGVKGKIKDKTYFAGNRAFMLENDIKPQGDRSELYENKIKPQGDRSELYENKIKPQGDKFELHKNKPQNSICEKADEFLSQGKTILYFAEDKNLIGVISVADTIKESSYDAIKALKEKKLDIVILTGDNKIVAEKISDNLGINTVIAEVLPQDKEKEVAKLQAKGKKVAFVGDGINDSPALVRADVGIAIGSGTDIAIESADIVLKNDNLLSVDTAIELSKAVMRNIKINLFWAFFYNCIGIPVAAGVFYLSYGLKLNPMIGAAAMSLSSVCVVTNALTLNLFKPKHGVKQKQLGNKLNQLVNELNRGGNVMNNYVKEINIEGMQCNHCKMTVEKVLTALDGVKKVEVNLENKNAIIESEKEIDNEKIIEVVTEAGFIVEKIN